IGVPAMKDNTDTAIKTAKPRGKAFKLSDGGGLHLLVSPNGSKLWRFRYRFNGTEGMIGFGSYNLGAAEHVPLALARERREEARRLIKDGKNPSAERRSTKGPASVQNSHGVTFEAAAKQWFAGHRKTLDIKYAKVIERRLDKWLYPDLGELPIAGITGPV